MSQIKFTKHALKQSKDRGIEHDEVKVIFTKEDDKMIVITVIARYFEE